MNDVLEGLIKSNVIEQIMFCIVLSIIKSFATSQQKTRDNILTSNILLSTMMIQKHHSYVLSWRYLSNRRAEQIMFIMKSIVM